MSLNVDQDEVLAHLQEMGYKNISAEQLQDFVRDLKKLIKYDVQNCICENWLSGYCTTCSSSTPTPLQRQPLSAMNLAHHQAKQGKHSEPKECTTGSLHREYTVTAEIKASHSKTIESGKLDHVKFDKENKFYSKENCKPASSYIRPWQLQRVPLPSRNDPVTLYHKYQNYWRKQKVPGENDHAELRWRVREKMVAQDPRPRPISQAASVESLYRRNRK